MTDITFLRCQHCSAALHPRPGHALNACSFCGSSYLIPVQSPAGDAAPIRWLPFTIGPTIARERFVAWLGASFVRPGDLVREAAVRDPAPVLVPLYLGRARAHSNWTAEVVRHRVKKVKVVIPPGGEIRTGDNVRMRSDSHFLSGAHDAEYENVFLLASRGVSDSSFATCADYDFVRLEPMPARERVDVPLEEPHLLPDDALGRVRAKIEAAEHSACERMIPGGQAVDVKVNTVVQDLKVDLIYVPLWVVSYRYHDKEYRALVNGMTGKVGGDAPISVPRALAIGSALLALPAAIAYFFWRRRR